MEKAEKQPPNKPWQKKIRGILLWAPILFRRILTKLYFRTQFYLTHKWRIKDFAFIHSWVLGIMVAILGILYMALYKAPFYFAIPSLSTELYIAENMLRTVSIFVSIVFAFIVLSFNVFYKYFGRFAFIQFFTSRYIKFIFTLFICNMGLLVYTCGYLKEGTARSPFGDGLFIYSIIASIILVLSIIPTMILLLRSSQNRDNIQRLIGQFNKDWSISYHLNVLWKTGNKNDHMQRDPIALLIEVGTAAIKDFDRASILAIKEGCLTHLKKMHAEYQVKPEVHPASFYEKLYDLTRSLYPVAIKERNEIAARIIINFHLEIEEFYLNNFKDFNVYKLPEHHYDGIGFKVVIREFLSKALQFNEDEVSEQIITALRRWWALVIESYLPGIGYDFPKGDKLPTDKTSFFISSTYFEFGNIFDQIFTYMKLFLYKEIAKFYALIGGEIVESKNTRNTIVYLLQQNGRSLMPLYEKYIDLSETGISWDVYPFHLGTAQEMTKIKSQIPLQFELRAFEYLFEKNKLNAFVINEIKATAYHAMAHFSEDAGYKNALLSIIRKFDNLRGYVTEGASDRQKETYLLLERYLVYIQEWTPEYKVTDEDVLSALSTSLSHFDLKEKFTQELDKKGFTIKDVR